MGYLAQRKKQMRTDFIFKIMLFVLGLFSLIAFGNNTLAQFLNEWRFQYYLILSIMLLYALVGRFWIYAFLSLLLLIINFLVISSSVSLFMPNEKTTETVPFKIIYQKEPSVLLDTFEEATTKKADVIAILNPVADDINPVDLLPDSYHLVGGENSGSLTVSSEVPLKAGRILLGTGNNAVFVTVKIDDRPYTILSVDLKPVADDKIPEVLGYIENFVAAQDDPVIIIGDFATPAWTPVMGTFLNNTGLKIKNELISSFSNFFLPPTFYVIGYKNLYFENLRQLPQRDNPHASLQIKLKI